MAAGRRAAGSIHEYLAGARDGEAEILAAVRYPTRPEPTLSLDIAARARAHPALPVIDTGTFSATQQGFTEPIARSEASRCFRCDAVYGCPSVSVVAGRGPADSRAGPAAPPPIPSTVVQSATQGGAQ